MKEHDLYTQIAQYLQLRYPSVIYRFDLAADLKLSIGQAHKHKALHPTRGYPDLFIAEPKEIARTEFEDKEKSIAFSFGHSRFGLFLEIKRPGVRIFKKDGTLVADQHIREQYDMLEQLRKRGYKAEFACGFDEAKKIIDEYLK